MKVLTWRSQIQIFYQQLLHTKHIVLQTVRNPLVPPCFSNSGFCRCSKSSLKNIRILNQCCGSWMVIPDPIFWLSSIPDLGSWIPDQTSTKKRRGKTFVVFTFSVAIISQNIQLFYFWKGTEKFLCNRWEHYVPSNHLISSRFLHKSIFSSENL
jgi:hypothetical protein